MGKSTVQPHQRLAEPIGDGRKQQRQAEKAKINKLFKVA